MRDHVNLFPMTCLSQVESTEPEVRMNFSPAWSRHFRALSDSKAIFLLLLLVPAAAHAQGRLTL